MQGFLEKMGFEKSAELKEMESVHSRQSAPHQQRPWGENEWHGLGLRSGRKWLREVRMSWEGWWTQGHRESNSPREIGRVIDSRGLANVEIEIPHPPILDRK